MVDNQSVHKSSNELDLRTKGLTITALGMVIISPDSLIIRLLSIDTWTILAWRGTLTALGILLIVVGRYRGDWWNRVREVGKPGLLVDSLVSSFMDHVALRGLAS